jgi:Cu(I)/Ag(I) efflux system membrane fusion protein
MKRILLIFSLMLIGGTILTSCRNSSGKEKQSDVQEVASIQYTCPMHPEVISDKPGDCPKCGMDLVEKK